MFAVVAGDMFWNGTGWVWERDEMLAFPDQATAEALRDDLAKQAEHLQDLFSVRLYLTE